jgi:hypothetical protein
MSPANARRDDVRMPGLCSQRPVVAHDGRSIVLYTCVYSDVMGPDPIRADHMEYMFVAAGSLLFEHGVCSVLN